MSDTRRPLFQDEARKSAFKAMFHKALKKYNNKSSARYLIRPVTRNHSDNEAALGSPDQVVRNDPNFVKSKSEGVFRPVKQTRKVLQVKSWFSKPDHSTVIKKWDSNNPTYSIANVLLLSGEIFGELFCEVQDTTYAANYFSVLFEFILYDLNFDPRHQRCFRAIIDYLICKENISEDHTVPLQTGGVTLKFLSGYLRLESVRKLQKEFVDMIVENLSSDDEMVIAILKLLIPCKYLPLGLRIFSQQLAAVIETAEKKQNITLGFIFLRYVNPLIMSLRSGSEPALPKPVEKKSFGRMRRNTESISVPNIYIRVSQRLQKLANNTMSSTPSAGSQQLHEQARDLLNQMFINLLANRSFDCPERISEHTENTASEYEYDTDHPPETVI